MTSLVKQLTRAPPISTRLFSAPKYLHRFYQMMQQTSFVLFDTEYTSWSNSLSTNWDNGQQRRELVQISAIKVSPFPEAKVVVKKDILVKCDVQLSQYFMDLTKITQKNVDMNGVRKHEGVKMFADFAGDLPIFSYGQDREILAENVADLGDFAKLRYGYWMASNFYDIRELFYLYGVDVYGYTSGSLYQYYGLDPKSFGYGNHQVHNAMWDTISLYQSLRWQYELAVQQLSLQPSESISQKDIEEDKVCQSACDNCT